MEETVKGLEKKWAAVQENALKHPSPGIISYIYFILNYIFWYMGRKD